MMIFYFYTLGSHCETAVNFYMDNFYFFSIIPVAIYTNADTQKLDILKDNKNKSGIYRWTNLKNGKTYIGSSIDFSKRLTNYFNITFLENEIKKNKSSIYRALLKYGYSQFSLEILEYCESENCIVREQYYLNLLPHEYNLLPNAGSLLGFKHSEETRAKQSIANKGEKNPRFPSEVKKQYIQKRRELNSQRLIKEKKIQCMEKQDLSEPVALLKE